MRVPDPACPHRRSDAGAPERTRLLRLAHAAPLPDTGCLHHPVETVALRRPGAIAVASGPHRLTYERLNDDANRLAHHLQALGVRPEVPVAIRLPAGVRLAIAVLAVLKAGGVCVPVDATASVQHLDFVLDDTGARLLLADGSLARDPACVDVLRIDGPGPWQAMPRANPASTGASSHLAWIVYAGSKAGVPLTHRALARLFAATEEWAAAQPDEAWAICAAPAEDMFVWEFFAPLLAGARAVFVPPVVARMPDRLVRLLERERIAVLNTTAPAFARLVHTDAQLAPNLRLRRIIVRGDAPVDDVLAAWRARHPDGPRLFTVHGSAETGIHATWRELDGARTGSFGRPLPDLSMYVLDAHGEPAPFGVPGDLYVGGPGLAPGYVNCADLTRERFVPHPFMPGERLFRTGIRARWLEDGTLDADTASIALPREAECRASAVAHTAMRFARPAPALRLRGQAPLPQRERGLSPCRER